jgi:hypothetical protein
LFAIKNVSRRITVASCAYPEESQDENQKSALFPSVRGAGGVADFAEK